MLVRGFQRVKQLTIAEEMSAADEASACSRLPEGENVAINTLKKEYYLTNLEGVS